VKDGFEGPIAQFVDMAKFTWFTEVLDWFRRDDDVGTNLSD